MNENNEKTGSVYPNPESSNIYPPSYIETQQPNYSTHYPQPALNPHTYANPNLVYVDPNLRPNYTIYRNDQILVTSPIVRVAGPQRVYGVYQPGPIAYDERLYLEKYPICYVVFHCLLLLLLAAGLIVTECIILDNNTRLSAMTSGWYCGGFMIGFAIFTLCTTCRKKLILIRIAVIFNFGVMVMCIGFAVIVAIIDMTSMYSASVCPEFNFSDNICYQYETFNRVYTAEVAKLVIGAMAIKFTLIYTGYVINLIRNKNKTITMNYQQTQPAIRTIY